MKQKASVSGHRPPQDHGETSSPNSCLSFARRWSLSTSASLSSTLSVSVLPRLPFCETLSVFMGWGWWGWSHKHVIINPRTMQSVLLPRKVDTDSVLWRHHKGISSPEIIRSAAHRMAPHFSALLKDSSSGGFKPPSICWETVTRPEDHVQSLVVCESLIQLRALDVCIMTGDARVSSTCLEKSFTLSQAAQMI